MLLALVLTAAPVELHVLSAGLLAPSTKTPVGAASDVTIDAKKWLSPTLMKAHHESTTVVLEALVDLDRDGTYVEALANRDVALAGTGPWTVVLKKGSRIPLVARVADGLRIAFLPEHFAVTQTATVPDADRPLPLAAGPAESCVVRAMHAKADPKSPRWEATSFAYTIHRGTPKSGWAPAWAEGGTLIVHGFVKDEDVECEVGSGGGLGLTGLGTASGDGSLQAQEAMLPAGTKLFASEREVEPFATLRAPVRGLKLDDGTWRIDHVKSGEGEVRFINVVIGKDTRVTLEAKKTHGVGSTRSEKPEWPHFKR
ncbi:MAG: hypothetical protein JNM69_35665 [Archangium sp.]|nr:hypothetical protein [Archangium sp.]